MQEFVTIEESVQAQITEKKSKFIANLVYVESVKEAEEQIKLIKKKYFDAKHNCIAYRIVEEEKIIERASDDGEPSGTAGGPMLNILQKNELANVLVVVTRYFGGILLGTGGLVRAYSDSLQKAIEESRKIKKCLGIELKVTLDYSYLEEFKYYCRNNEIQIVKTEYLEDVVCNIELQIDVKNKLFNDYETKKLKLKEIQELSKKFVAKSK